MGDSFDKVDDNYKIIRILEKIKEKSIKKYHEWIDECSGRNYAGRNDKIRNISYEFASFISGLESEINSYGTNHLCIGDYKNSESLRHLKNDIVDVIYPLNKERCRSREEYQNNLRKAGKLADMLEDFFMLAYSLGKGSQYLDNKKETEMDETCFNEYMEDCRRKLEIAYNNGSRELMFMLQLAINSPEAMKEFKERGML